MFHGRKWDLPPLQPWFRTGPVLPGRGSRRHSERLLVAISLLNNALLRQCSHTQDTPPHWSPIPPVRMKSTIRFSNPVTATAPIPNTVMMSRITNVVRMLRSPSSLLMGRHRETQSYHSCTRPHSHPLAHIHCMFLVSTGPCQRSFDGGMAPIGHRRVPCASFEGR